MTPKKINHGKKPTLKHMELLSSAGDSEGVKCGKEKASIVCFLTVKTIKYLTFHSHNYAIPALMDCVL